jgi:hypothetical protein
MDMPQRSLVPLLRKLDLPVTADVESGEFYTSKTEFRALIEEVSE